MNHYFDDVFTRHVTAAKPKAPGLRRSSTTRSMGARSDFDTSIADDDDQRSIGNSVGLEDAEMERERKEADYHTANYVSEQLQKVRSHVSDYDNGDEFEAQLDGQ